MDYARAVAEFEKSRDLFARLGDECEAAVAESRVVQFLLDSPKVAEGRARATTLIETARSRKFNVLLPTAYYWLGVGEYHESNLSATSRNYKTALRLAEAGGNASEVEHVQDALTLYYSALGELEPALAHASTLLSGGGDLYYQDPVQAWRNRGTLAGLTLKLKFFATSLSFSKERLDIVRESPPDSIRMNSSLHRMVRTATEQGDFDAALKYAEESRQLALGRPDSPENTRMTAELYLLLADVKSKLNDCTEALADYDKSLELYGHLPSITVNLYQIHKGKLFCFQQLERPEDFSVELREVLKLSENYRASIREDEARQTFFANEQDVFDAATTNAVKARDARLAFDFVEKSRARSLLDFVESGRSIAEVETAFASVSRPLTLAEIQKRLPENLQFVQYAVLPDRLAIWVVSNARFELIERPVTAYELEKKIDAYQASVVSKKPAGELKAAAKELYEILIPPDLDTGKQLCIVPDKSLHQLAFASLVSPAGKYLLEDFALFYSPSASVMILSTENARRKEGGGDESILSVGNPAFDHEENPNLADLRSAEIEAKTIAGGYGKAFELLGDEATKEAFLRGFAGVDVIHFAGHFLANRRSPGNSKLLFAGGDLRSSELGAYKLPKAKLIVLSACETGFERYNKSEGAIGIARTFLALGAPLVVASQWKVDSEFTKDLMIAFHRNRREKGLASAKSLREAQLEVLSRDRSMPPFYWAAFSLFGGYANY